MFGSLHPFLRAEYLSPQTLMWRGRSLTCRRSIGVGLSFVLPLLLSCSLAVDGVDGAVALCRFKDGSIVEAVVWKGKGAQRHRVVEQVS